MRKPLIALGCSLLALTSLALSAADPASNPAVTLNFDDPQLQWGPCPPFLPAGCGIAVLHGDPAKPNVDIFLKVPAGSTIPMHTHTSAERMILVSGELEVSYEGQKPTTMKAGSYAYGPASRPHDATCAKGAVCVLFVAFEAPLDAIPIGK